MGGARVDQDVVQDVVSVVQLAQLAQKLRSS